ncbi:hypothetical protein K8I61_08855 [bacterium]|nr:hypothetical protein [bacterium]
MMRRHPLPLHHVRSALLAMALFAALVALSGCGCGDDDDDDASPSPATDDDAASDDDDAVEDDDASDDDREWPDPDPPPGADDDDDGAPFPAPGFDPAARGAWPVGNTTFVFVDETRRDPATHDVRTLVTEVWYPATDAALDLPRDTLDAFFGDWIAQVLAMLAAEGATPDELANLYAQTGSARDAPIRAGDAPFGLIVFSHGLGGLRLQNFTTMEYLASHGFVVMAPDHTGNAAITPLPDGPVPFNENLVPVSYGQRKKDISFLIDTMTSMARSDSGTMFAGLVDPGRVATLGHSFGGTCAVESARDDRRIRAAAVMASFMFPWTSPGFDAARFFMFGLEDDSMGDATFLFRYDYAISPSPKVKVEMRDAGHYTFTDACLLLPSLFGDGDGCGMGNRRKTGEPFAFVDHAVAHAVIDPYLTAFYGYNLRGEASMAAFLGVNHAPELIEHESEIPNPEP